MDESIVDYLLNLEVDTNKICAHCHMPIRGTYHMIGDNWLQAKYFDNLEDNIFCSKGCLLESLYVLEVDNKTEVPYKLHLEREDW